MAAQVQVDQKRIKNRIAARNQAMSVFDLACMSIYLSDGTPEWDDGYGADYADAFIDSLVAELRKKLPSRRQEPVAEEKPEPLARLAATKIDFGLHSGRTLDDIPLQYLDWLCSRQEELCKLLRKYLKHPELNRID